jgi:hypothetical protein
MVACPQLPRLVSSSLVLIFKSRHIFVSRAVVYPPTLRPATVIFHLHRPPPPHNQSSSHVHRPRNVPQSLFIRPPVPHVRIARHARPPLNAMSYITRQRSTVTTNPTAIPNSSPSNQLTFSTYIAPDVSSALTPTGLLITVTHLRFRSVLNTTFLVISQPRQSTMQIGVEIATPRYPHHPTFGYRGMPVPRTSAG